MANTAIQRAAARTAARQSGEKPITMQDYINRMAPGIKAALPSVITPERFTRITLSALSTDPKLAKCTPQSFLGAMMTAAQLGLEPNTPLGQAYLLPYRNNKKGGILECQFQLGYKGMIDLARRSGDVSVIMAQVVHENDEFTYSFGLEPTLKHVPALGDRGAPKFVYGLFRTKDGGYGYDVMTIDDVRAHARRYSPAFDKGPWQTNFEEMAKKTVLKRVLKYAPLKSEFTRGLAQDESIKTELDKDMYEVPDMFPADDTEVYEVDEATGEVITPGEDSPAAGGDEGEQQTLG